METLSQRLRWQVGEFCRRADMTPPKWSVDCFGHYEYGRRLLSGDSFTAKTFDKAQEYFLEHGYDPDELARSGADRETAA